MIGLIAVAAAFAGISWCALRTPVGSSTGRSTAEYSLPSTERTRPPVGERPSAPADSGGTTHCVVNGEGEVYIIDTSIEHSPFYGPVWNRILAAYENEEYVRARILFRRRAANNYFAGYETEIDGVRAFLPRSKCGFFWDEEIDATGRNVIVKPFQIHPSGPRAGSLLVDAASPLEELDREKQPEWCIGIDFDHERFYLAQGKKKIAWCLPSEIAAVIPPSVGIGSLAEAAGFYYRVIPARSGEAGRVLPLEILA